MKEVYLLLRMDFIGYSGSELLSGSKFNFFSERLQVGQYQGFYMAIQMDIYKIL
jgi:hypothetical protein